MVVVIVTIGKLCEKIKLFFLRYYVFFSIYCVALGLLMLVYCLQERSSFNNKYPTLQLRPRSGVDFGSEHDDSSGRYINPSKSSSSLSSPAPLELKSLRDGNVREMEVEPAKLALIDRYVPLFNKMGKSWVNIYTLESYLVEEDESDFKEEIWKSSRDNMQEIKRNRHDFPPVNVPWKMAKTSVNLDVVTIVCSSNYHEFLAMVKTLVIFSEDANLNLIVFSDDSTILSVAQELMKLKWTVMSLGKGWNFSYNLYRDRIPEQYSKLSRMWIPCSSQKLFLPMQLPHLNAIIYVDPTKVFLSSVTDMWGLTSLLKSSKLIIAHSNHSPEPFYSGVMIMDLQEMRAFNFVERAISSMKLHKDRLNSSITPTSEIFSTLRQAFPEKFQLLDCTYNFDWSNCERQLNDKCDQKMLESKSVFTNSTCADWIHRGIHILHGSAIGNRIQANNSQNNPPVPFPIETQSRFYKMNLLTDEMWMVVQGMKEYLNSGNQPCATLNSSLLFMNVDKYFQKMQGWS